MKKTRYQSANFTRIFYSHRFIRKPERGLKGRTKLDYSQAGFTLTEMIVAITIFVLIVVTIYSSYALSHRAYLGGERAAEITQNGRVIIERIAREIRQAKEIVTELSADEIGATSTILFQDGHDISTIRYIHYFKDNNNIKREVIAYYFPSNPNIYVSWNARDENNNPPNSTTTEKARIIGEYVDNLKFWGTPVINISLTLKKDEKVLNLRTKIRARNL